MNDGRRNKEIGIFGWFVVLIWIVLIAIIAGLTMHMVQFARQAEQLAADELVRYEALTLLDAEATFLVRGFDWLQDDINSDPTAVLVESAAWRMAMSNEVRSLESIVDQFRVIVGTHRADSVTRMDLLLVEINHAISEVGVAEVAGDVQGVIAMRNDTLDAAQSLGDLAKDERRYTYHAYSMRMVDLTRSVARLQAVSLFLILATIAVAVLYVRIRRRIAQGDIRHLTEEVHRMIAADDTVRGIEGVFTDGVIARLARRIDDFAKVRGYALQDARLAEEKLRGMVSRMPSATVHSSEDPHVQQQRDSERAMLNLLEDLQDERNLSQREAARLNAVITSINDGVLMVSADQRIRVMNPTAMRMYGLGGAEVIGAVYQDLLPKFEDMKGVPLPAAQHPIRKTLETGQITSGQLTIVRDHGSLPVSFHAAPVVSGSEIMGAVIVFRDIVDEVELDRAKSEFVSIASHQLKTPLNGVRWYLESILAGDYGKMDAKLSSAMDDVHTLSVQMTQLIDTLLNVSRIESGRLSVVPVPTSLAEVVDEVLTEVKPDVTEKRIKVSTTYDEEVPNIVLDRNLTKIAIENIVTNAVKYSRDGGDIFITLEHVDEVARLTVKDEGYGIPFEEQKHIFKKMFRAKNVQDRNIDGNGLGLYIAKSVIKSLGGDIWFESVVDEGTTFFVNIPLKGVEAKKGDRSLIV